jgi:hypothetical protein
MSFSVTRASQTSESRGYAFDMAGTPYMRIRLFSRDTRWVHTVEQTLVQINQIVEVQRVELGERAIETIHAPR